MTRLLIALAVAFLTGFGAAAYALHDVTRPRDNRDPEGDLT